MHAGAVAALAFPPLSVPASATNQAAPGSATAGIDCPGGYVCIYPEINFGGQPWVRRAVGGGVKDLPSAIRDRGSSIRNNSDRTARVYEKRNYTGRWVCVTRSGGSIHDLRGYNWMRYGYRFGYVYLGAGSNPCHNRCERRANGRDGEGVSSACEPAAATVEARRLHVRTAGGGSWDRRTEKPPATGRRTGRCARRRRPERARCRRRSGRRCAGFTQGAARSRGTRQARAASAHGQQSVQGGRRSG
ncbi:peptidase inhibitor family I36 protein [Streptomyces sp. 2-6]|uniref:peptidase inhibitor family I36 protein n=1 Tax=Streptomyces sp. 2-6 TaxID=2978333 RepID=UPI003D0F79D7